MGSMFTIEPEVVKARNAIIRLGQTHPDVRWSSREIREAARNGGNPGALGLALDELLDDGTFVRDTQDQRISWSGN